MKTKPITRQLVEALEETVEELRRAYAAAYCGPQPWSDEQREEFRLKACAADLSAQKALAAAEATP